MSKSVDLVNFDEMSIFMFVDDLAYQTVPEERKHYSVVQHVQARKTGTWGLGFDSQTRITRDNIVAALLEHHWAHRLDFTYVDVGCQYGSSAIVVAGYIRQHARGKKVICFEPGVAGELVPHNIKLNGMEKLIVFEHRAVGEHSLPCLMFHDEGHTENNRMTHRRPDSFGFVADGVSIDDYVVQHDINHPLIMKIDTEGAEPLVFRGMERARASRPVTAIMEFCPGPMTTLMDPEKFLEWVSEDCDLFDLRAGEPDGSVGIQHVRRDDIHDLTQNVLNSASGWTDLLLIPQQLPGAAELAARISGSAPAGTERRSG